MEKKKSILSESYVLGVIALVFLIVVYQTALFVYRASVMKIVSNRDDPDTVYICQTISAKSDSSSIHRISSEHSKAAQIVRKSAPRRQIESFRFNPNTANMEDFQRLGFSEKQAQSIINYREKGGIYRRRSDFAKSFVVSDSVYRRLEQYIDIPLVDLNLADSADFDALPGIGGWFATKMVEHRKALGGYSYKEQLLDIYNFTEDKYQGLEDLITVSPEHMTPYALWELPADSLRLHPYIKDYETARSIVLYRENSDKNSLTVENLYNAGILTYDNAYRLSRCQIQESE